jgi:hypothetical protein
MPTFLDIHGLEIPPPPEVRSHSLLPVLARDETIRDTAIFGLFSGPIGITDGEWVLYHYPPDIFKEGLTEYTLAPAHMTVPFSIDELKTARLAPPFDFTKGVPLLGFDAIRTAPRPPGNDLKSFDDLGTRLYNVARDPLRQSPTENPEILEFLYRQLTCHLKAHDSPAEIYGWYGLVNMN